MAIVKPARRVGGLVAGAMLAAASCATARATTGPACSSACLADASAVQYRDAPVDRQAPNERSAVTDDAGRRVAERNSANGPPLIVTLDRFGRCQVNGRSLERIFLRQGLREALAESEPSSVQLRLAAGVLPEDAEQLREALEACGVDAGRIETRQAASAPMTRSDRQAASRFFRAQIDLQRTLWERFGRQQQRFTEMLHGRWSEMRRRAALLAEYAAPLRQGLDDLVGRAPSTQPAR